MPPPACKHPNPPASEGCSNICGWNAPPGRYLEGLFEGVAGEDLAAVAAGELAAAGGGWVKLVFGFPEHFTGPASFSGASASYSTGVVRALCDHVHALDGRVAAHVSGPGDAAAAISLGIDSLEHGPDVPLESLGILGQRGGAWTPTPSRPAPQPPGPT